MCQSLGDKVILAYASLYQRAQMLYKYIALALYMSMVQYINIIVGSYTTSRGAGCLQQNVAQR